MRIQQVLTATTAVMCAMTAFAQIPSGFKIPIKVERNKPSKGQRVPKREVEEIRCFLNGDRVILNVDFTGNASSTLTEVFSARSWSTTFTAPVENHELVFDGAPGTYVINITVDDATYEGKFQIAD